MRKTIRCMIALLLAGCSFVSHAEQWRIHPTFDGNLSQIVDTPEFTYFVSNNQPWLATVPEMAVPDRGLFRYDKKGDELQVLNTANCLSDSRVNIVRYNPEGKYLCVTYDNGNVDLIFNDGNVKNIPGFKLASDEYGKIVNCIVFNPDTREIYLATDFGFIVCDEVKGEVKYTRNLHRNVTAVGRLGDAVLVGTEQGLFRSSPASHAEISEMQQLEGFANVRDMVRHDDKLYVLNGEGYQAGIPYLTIDNDVLYKNDWIVTNITDLKRSKTGLFILGPEDIWVSGNDLSLTHTHLLPEDVGKVAACWDTSAYWFSDGRAGITRKRADLDDNGAVKWTIEMEGMKPNAANAYKSTGFLYHPEYGMLVRNHGVSPVFMNHDIQIPDLLSAYRDGAWTPMSTTYRLGNRHFEQWNPSGLVPDPNNGNYVWSGSVLHGLLRLDLKDPSKSIRLGRNGDPSMGTGNYIGIFNDDSWPELNIMSKPAFDAEGNLWAVNLRFDEPQENNTYFFLWPAEARGKTTGAADYKPIKRWKWDGLKGTTLAVVVPLLHSSSKNMVIYSNGSDKYPPVVINHNGTLESTSDDKMVIPTELIDQDGSKVTFESIRVVVEDVSTGLVWCGTDQGLFTFRPAELFSTGSRVNRIKVSRNDGTNLADYLLDGVTVNYIYMDSSGKKWICTMGGGIVVTSPDGTEVLKTYNTENSQLPDNDVYGICYNPDNHSMMISTDKGLAEMFLTSRRGDDEKSSLKVYPNPVRSDFYGYVTIEGLADNALVKVVDAGGNLIKEVGFAAGGEAQWDVTNLNMKRVPTGVYYILATNGPDDDKYSSSAKILVVN